MALTAAVLHAGERKFKAEMGRHPCDLISFALANVKTMVITALAFVIMIKRMMCLLRHSSWTDKGSANWIIDRGAVLGLLSSPPRSVGMGLQFVSTCWTGQSCSVCQDLGHAKPWD